MGNLLNMSGGSLLGKGSLLPSGYRQLEYIENTSNAYIDTGCEIGDKFEIESSAMPMFGLRLDSVSYSGNLLGVKYNNVRFFYSNASSFDFYGANNNNGYVPIAKNKNINTMLYITYSVRSIYIKCGTYIYTTNITALFPYPYSLYLFARNDSGTYEEGSQGTWRIYTMTFKNDGVPVRNFIPCKNPNNVVGMYDTVEGEFYSSPNGTAFIAGPEV